VADAHYHGDTVMRIIRISKCRTLRRLRSPPARGWPGRGAQLPICDCR
jgi:hypothetical protein